MRRLFIVDLRLEILEEFLIMSCEIEQIHFVVFLVGWIKYGRMCGDIRNSKIMSATFSVSHCFVLLSTDSNAARHSVERIIS